MHHPIYCLLPFLITPVICKERESASKSLIRISTLCLILSLKLSMKTKERKDRKQLENQRSWLSTGKAGELGGLFSRGKWTQGKEIHSITRVSVGKDVVQWGRLQ